MDTPSLVVRSHWNPRGRSDRTREAFHVAPFSSNPTTIQRQEAAEEFQRMGANRGFSVS
jgi:hypothetical protein